MSPNSVAPGADTSFTLGLYNGNDNPIQWIRMFRPPNDLVTLESASAWAWDGELTDENTVTFANGSLPHGSSQGFSVQALAAGTPGGPENWSVEISDEPDGSNPIGCTDADLSLRIEMQPSIINIINAHVTNVSDTSVTVLWDTDVPSNSQVEYGADENYGNSTPVDSSLVTSHSVTLSGLSPNSGYHYRVRSATPADGGTADSSDSTYLTAMHVIFAGGTASAGGGATGANVPGVEIKPVPTEHVPPTVSLSTDFSKPFRQPPRISGSAADNEDVARVEYSLDEGKNWLPVSGLSLVDGSSAQVDFDFTPPPLDDGNYELVVRATDSSGNQASSPPVTLVIDRLPPQVGPLTVSYGPEVISPDSSGVTNIVAGSDYRLAASVVGGATSVVLEASLLGQKAGAPGGGAAAQSFTLTQAPDSGLWGGVLSFLRPGVYKLTAQSLDGAGNHTTRELTTVAVAPAGRVTQFNNGKAVPGATVTLYYLEPASHTWTVWDGAPYGQTNPQRTNAQGAYSLVIPAGTYYLKASAPDFNTYVSNIFHADSVTGLTPNLPLSTHPHVSLGKLKLAFPEINLESHRIKLSAFSTSMKPASLAGSILPDFQLPTVYGATKRSIDFEGKPTVLTLLSTWSPTSQDQLPALAEAQKNSDVNVSPVFEQEHSGLVSAYLQTAGYHLDGLIDADGVLVPALQAGPMPKHIFIDRSGRIKQVVVGVLSSQQITNGLGGL